MDPKALQERLGIIGNSLALRNVLQRVMQVARTDITVLVHGESGVGKELIAKAVHELSTRRRYPQLTVNCGAIPEGLIESELFGAEKGAYTGAVSQRAGVFEEANGGTVFLDEIGEMPLAAQVRLLRVLENGEYSRVGSAQVRKTNVRIVAATNKDLGHEVQARRFREDLYYRLSTVIIEVPPLRDRRDDILALFDHFVRQFAEKYSIPPKQLDVTARQLLSQYRWPGNVRELRNVAERAVVLIRHPELSARDLREFLRGVTASGTAEFLPALASPAERSESNGFANTADAREREIVYRALLEIRTDLRDLKEQIQQVVGGMPGRRPERATVRDDEPPRGKDFVILRSDEPAPYTPIEDVAYEIEPDDGLYLAAPRAEESSIPAPSSEPELPTLEEAERRLIEAALERFDGNRRQTAQALGISERTLYRKLRDYEEAADQEAVSDA
ncbi:MAG: sigma-54 dependent transcriptional regulator [Bacteroidota bacterium]